MEILPTTRIIDLTIGQFEDWMLSKGFVPQASAERPKRFVYGIPGIMELLNVSESTAHRLKRGILSPAISQQGRKIIVDADRALELFKSSK